MDNEIISEAINTASFAASNLVYEYAAFAEHDYETLEALARGVQVRVVETATTVLNSRSENG
jgi:hypothetical protein